MSGNDFDHVAFHAQSAREALAHAADCPLDELATYLHSAQVRLGIAIERAREAGEVDVAYRLGRVRDMLVDSPGREREDVHKRARGVSASVRVATRRLDKTDLV